MIPPCPWWYYEIDDDVDASKIAFYIDTLNPGVDGQSRNQLTGEVHGDSKSDCNVKALGKTLTI